MLDVHRLAGDAVDLRGPRVQALLRFFLDAVSDAARATLPASQAGLLAARLKAAAEGWEDRLEVR